MCSIQKFFLVMHRNLKAGICIILIGVVTSSTGWTEERRSLQRIKEALYKHKEIVVEWKNKPILNVSKERPRLLPSKKDIPKFKERLQWLKFDEWEKTGRIKYWRGASSHLLYFITGEKKYKEMMLTNLSKLLKKEIEKGGGGAFLSNPPIASGIAEIYDVLYNELTEEQKKEARKKMIEVAEACMLGKVPGAGCYMGLGYHNGFYFQLSALARVGYAIYGDDPKGEEYIKKAYDLFLNETIPAILFPGKGGGWWEGTDYQHFAVPNLVRYIEIVNEATGVDLMEIKELRDFIHLNAYFIIYGCYPWRSNFEWYEDNAVARRMYCSGDVFEGLRFPAQHKRRFLLYLLKRTRDPYIQWFIRNSGNQLNRTLTGDFALEVLHNTTDIPEKPLDDLPLVNFIEGMGLLFVRSDWTEEATWAVMQIVPQHTNHSWAQSNKIGINRCGELLADMYGNCEIRGIGTGGGSAHSFWRVAENPERYTQSEVSAFDMSKYHVYCLGDAGKCYKNGKEAIRQFVYLRPHTFVIFDRIESNQPDPGIYYSANFHHMPVVNRDTAIVDATVIKERVQKMVKPGWYPKIDVDPNVDWKEVTKDTVPTVPYKGRLFHKTLLPKKANLSVEKRNFLGEWDQYDLICKYESQPTKPCWLTICYAGTKEVKEMPSAELIEAKGKAGAKITADGKTYEVWFISEGKKGGSVKITDNGGKVLIESNFPESIQNVPDILSSLGERKLYPVR